jgi:hypothetical protein
LISQLLTIVKEML